MRASLSLAGLGLGLFAASAVAHKIVSLPFSRTGGTGTASGRTTNSSVRKRGGTYSQELINNLTVGGYYAHVSLGTPPQPVTLTVDTGSSDVWILDSRADLCQSTTKQHYYGTCLATYDPAQSSTYQLVDRGGFSIEYLDSSAANGDYIKDNFHIAGADIDALQVGLAKTSTINSGLLGIGFHTNVAARHPYRNIVDLLADQGLIDTQAYSLYLDDLHAETGTILFGGIDNTKFIGQLKSVDILRDRYSKIYSSLTVALGSLVVSSGSKSQSSDLLRAQEPVVLDSGTSLTYLPPAVTKRIYAEFDVVDDTDHSGLAFVKCGLLTLNKDTTLDFQFGAGDGPLVKVPIDELVLDNVKAYIALGLQVPADLPFNNVCTFGIQSLPGISLLGDTFLRSAYVAYDLTHKKIALAQANLNATGTHLMEITAASGIPLVNGTAVPETSSTGGDKNDTGSSETDSPAPRTMPALQWETAAVALATTSFCLAGAGLFAL
ncbi:aspartic peptidase domain-containing protein [Xylaria venustula]|nr:aspartic peptidase domain-containing protein [Xylaria venustula]